MINQSAWKTDDPEWGAKREKLWLEIKAWFDERGLWSEDYLIEQPLAYEAFYKMAKLDEQFNFWGHLGILHPLPSVDDINYLVGLRSEYSGAYILPYGSQYWPLVEKGLVSKQALITTFLAFSGQNYNDMAGLRGFDVIEVLPFAVEQIVPIITQWFKNGTPEDTPIDLLIPHLTSVLDYITPETLGKTKFYVKRLCKSVGRYKPVASSDPDSQTRIANELKAYLLSDKVHECVRGIATEFIK
jgi:hypothetical protein